MAQGATVEGVAGTAEVQAGRLGAAAPGAVAWGMGAEQGGVVRAAAAAEAKVAALMVVGGTMGVGSLVETEVMGDKRAVVGMATRAAALVEGVESYTGQRVSAGAPLVMQAMWEPARTWAPVVKGVAASGMATWSTREACVGGRLALAKLGAVECEAGVTVAQKEARKARGKAHLVGRAARVETVAENMVKAAAVAAVGAGVVMAVLGAATDRKRC